MMHTVELNAGTMDTDAGPLLQANWTWAPSALDHAQVSRLSRLWFEALAGICAHVRGGGGGLTPSDIAPARLSQQQIDELTSSIQVADVLPLTPLQQGLLFHASIAQGAGDDVYAVQLDITVTGALDPHRLRDAVHTVVDRHPNLAARFCDQFDEPVQIIPADPVIAWRYLELRRRRVDADEQIEQLCAAERAAVCDLADRPTFRAALIRTGGGPAPVRADQPPHRDGRLVAADPAAGDLRQLFRAAAARRRRRIAGSSLGWPVGISRPPARHGREVLGRVRHPDPGRPAGPAGARAARRGIVSGVRARPRGRSASWRAHATPPSARCCRRAWAQLLMSLTGQHDVAFGAAVSGRPAEMAGAESMVGLLINTVPVRARITRDDHHRRAARSAAKCPQRHP